MKKIYGIVSWRGERKAMSMLEFIVCITVCAVAVFGWSEDMNSNQILPKQYYTLMAVSVAVIVLAVKVLIGKRIRLDFGIMSVLIFVICTVEAIYALCQWMDWAVPNMTYRVTGHFDNPAGLVACLCVGIPFSLYQYGRIPTKVIFICLSIIFMAIIISKSRTGIMAASVLLIDFVLRLREVTVRKRATVIVVVATTLIVVGYFLKRDSADGRMLIWLCSCDMLCDSPWVGHGIDSFRRFYMDYQADWLVSHPGNTYAMLADNAVAPFNEFLNFTLCFGIMGICGLVALIVFVWRVARKSPSSERYTALSLLGCVGLMSLFSYPFTYPLTWITVITCVMVLIVETIKFSMAVRRMLAWAAILTVAVLSGSIWKRIEAEFRWKDTYMTHDLAGYECLMPMLGKEPFFLYNYAVELMGKGEVGRSLEVALMCDEYLAHYDLELLLGDLYTMRGEFALAESRYIRACAMCPCRFVPLNQLYDLYMAHGHEDEALAIARKVVDKQVKVKSLFHNKCY